MTEETRFATIEGSERSLPEGARRLGRVADDARMEISVYLKPKGEHDVVGQERDHGRRRALLAAHRDRVHADDIAAIDAFASAHGLSVTERAPGRRLVKLSGSARDVERAFRTELHEVEHQGGRFRGRTGTLSMPAHLQPAVESVLGIDDRPVARSQMRRLAAGASGVPHLPNALGALYDFPTGVTGAGQVIALIELGGGYADSDNAAAFKAMGLAVPKVTAVSVDGATNTTGSDADGEVALDIQVAGGNAPGAAIAVYFAPNTDQGFADAITQATHDTTNAVTVMSISWGGPESGWTTQATTTMDTAIADAGTLGISVFVAAGDNLATDGVTDGHAHVDFPASSPSAIGCGGTNVTTSGRAITAETVWNDETSGTGGGISDLFPVPSFQSGVTLPPSVNKGRVGRGVPDVAGDAAPATGYTIVVDGQSETVGGTSAVAPLWAGLTALLNQSLDTKLGFFLATLYANRSGFVEITTGDNKPEGSTIGYDAGPTWNACTGLGRPDGNKLLAVLKAASADT